DFPDPGAFRWRPPALRGAAVACRAGDHPGDRYTGGDTHPLPRPSLSAPMADPDEGVAADGTIRTGARRDRVPAIFEPVMTDAVAFLRESGASLSVYGCVA